MQAELHALEGASRNNLTNKEDECSFWFSPKKPSSLLTGQRCVEEGKCSAHQGLLAMGRAPTHHGFVWGLVTEGE